MREVSSAPKNLRFPLRVLIVMQEWATERCASWCSFILILHAYFKQMFFNVFFCIKVPVGNSFGISLIHAVWSTYSWHLISCLDSHVGDVLHQLTMARLTVPLCITTVFITCCFNVYLLEHITRYGFIVSFYTFRHELIIVLCCNWQEGTRGWEPCYICSVFIHFGRRVPFRIKLLYQKTECSTQVSLTDAMEGFLL